MNLQLERITELASHLQRDSLAQSGIAIAQQASEQEWSYLDYLEQALKDEHQAREQRKQALYTRLAGFPDLKTFDTFDFEFAAGMPKKQVLG